MTDELRERLDRSYDKVKVKRGTERGLRKDVEAAEDALAALQDEEQRLHRSIHAMAREKAEADATVQDQAEKVRRAERRLQRLRGDLRSRGPPAGGDGGETPLEVDLALTDTREVNRALLAELRALARDHPKAGVEGQLEAAGLRLPGSTRPGSAASQGSARAVRSRAGR